MDAPGFRDVLRARAVIGRYLPRTPLHNYPALDALLSARVYIKHENYHATGAFKVRGGINLMANLTQPERSAGVVTASTGNHGQSIAYAARVFSVPATIVVPEGANPVKVEAIQSHGARVIVHGHDFDDAKAHCEELAHKFKARYISSGDEPLLIAGVATYTLEIFEDLPDVEVIIVPIAGGSGAAGACLVSRSLASREQVQVIGVQSSAAPGAYLTWKSRQMAERRIETKAEGLQTRTPFQLPMQILWESLDDFVLVDDDRLFQAVLFLLQKAKTLAEPAGAASLAAALAHPELVYGKKIALVLSGGNISPTQLGEVLDCIPLRAGH